MPGVGSVKLGLDKPSALAMESKCEAARAVVLSELVAVLYKIVNFMF